MSENPAERAQTYLKTIEVALEVTEGVNDPNLLRIIDYAKRYVADSKYFLESGKPTTALASVAYAEGLIDSLKILGLTSPSDATRSSGQPRLLPRVGNDISTIRS